MQESLASDRPDAVSGARRGALLALALAAEMAGLLTVGWRRWADVLVDFGRELYVPWRLAEGAALYRDVAYFNGPLAPWCNAAWFQCFGVSWSTQLAANLALFLFLLWLLFRFFRQTADFKTAAFVTLLVPPLFGLAHYTATGNYNWLAPYSHDLTYGALLAVAQTVALAAALRAGRPERRRYLELAAGFCLGLTLLTKVDAAAGALAVAGGYALMARSVLSAGRVVAMAALPVAGALAALAQSMPLAEAWEHVSFAWRLVLFGALSKEPFYLWVTGLDAPAENLLSILQETLTTGLLLGAICCLGAAYVFKDETRLALALGGMGMFIATLALKDAFPWLMQGRSLPALTLAMGAWLAWRLRKETERAERARLQGLLLWAVLSLLFLAKMGLNPKFYHYGFALALPAGCLVIWGVVWLLPRALHALLPEGLSMKATKNAAGLAMAVLCLDATVVTLWSGLNYAEKTYAIGQGGDTFLTYPKAKSITPPGDAMGELLAVAERLTASLPAENRSLAVYPEGVLVNYLLRVPAPVPWTSYMPPEQAMYGRARMLDSLKAAAPGLVVAQPRNMGEYDLGATGPLDYDPAKRYTPEFLDWLEADYGLVWRWERPGREYFPVSIYKKGAANATAPAPRKGARQ